MAKIRRSTLKAKKALEFCCNEREPINRPLLMILRHSLCFCYLSPEEDAETDSLFFS